MTLSTAAIFQGMAAALPDNTGLASACEAVALLTHAFLAALDFALCGLDEDTPLPAGSQAKAPRLSPQWNASPGSLVFVYTHKLSPMRFVVRVDRLGPRLEVRGLAVGDNNIHSVQRLVADVVSPAALPVAPTADAHDLQSRLRAAFVSDQAVADLLRDLKVSVVQKLIPKLQEEGHVEADDESAQATARAERRDHEARNPMRPFRADSEPNEPGPYSAPVPAMARPRPAPVGDFPPPGFDDEYDMNRPPHGAFPLSDGRLPLGMGHDDLNPPGLGPHDPFRGSFTGGGGLPRPGGPSGMHPTFDDPLFGGDPGAPPGGYDPQAPPGARWDPVGPGAGPKFRGPSGGAPFGGGGGFGGGFGGHI